MLGGRECVDDDQPSAAAWAGQREDAGWLIGIAFTCVFSIWWLGPKQASYPGDIGGSVAISEEAVVADAVLAFWQDMDQEPSDEL